VLPPRACSNVALYSWRIGSEIWTEVASRNIFDELFGRVRRISLSFAVRVEMRDEIVRFTAEMKRVAGSGTLAIAHKCGLMKCPTQ